MRFKIDENLPLVVAELLRQEGERQAAKTKNHGCNTGGPRMDEVEWRMGDMER